MGGRQQRDGGAAQAVPPAEEWPSLRPPLTEGERRLAEYLAEVLPSPWVVYVQPRINDIHPDVVAMHPTLGVAVYEVKDWTPGVRRLVPRGSRLWSIDPESGREYVTDNGVDQAVRYRSRLLERYSTMALDAKTERWKLVTAGVMLTHYTTEAALDLVGRFRPGDDQQQPARRPYFRIFGGDALTPEGLSTVLPVAVDPGLAGPFEPKHREQLRWLLDEPEHRREQRQPLELDRAKQQLLDRPARRRRVRGAAGTGKSSLLAAQAAKWALDGKRVLVVGYNITLWHHLRDLAHRYRPTARAGEAEAVGRAVRDRITFTYLHGWCEDVCARAGRGKELRTLLGGSHGYPETGVRELVNDAFDEADPSSGLGSMYDAICVDEGQDVGLEWWDLLQRCVDGDAPMLLVADPTQGLYGAERRWTDVGMSGAGFSGSWVTLTGSHRLPIELIDPLRAFVGEFLGDRDIDLPDPPAEPPLPTCTMRWTQVQPDALVDHVAARAADAPRELGISPDDCAVLLATHDEGLRVVGQVEAEHSTLEVAHVFGATQEEQKRRKVMFWAGRGALKASTIHSYKGWEARSVVLGIDPLPDEGTRPSGGIDRSSALSAAYVGMSRVAKSDAGSLLEVVCAEPELEAFGRRWFGDGFTSA